MWELINLIPSILNNRALERILQKFIEFILNVPVIITSRIFYTMISSWLIASVIKMWLYSLRYHKINFKLLVETGGMPSSHTAFVVGLAASVGFEAGWSSPAFLAMLGLAIIVISDAVGVRRAVGKQAEILNQMVDELYETGSITEGRLKELLGHTPIEAIVGGLIGLGTALMFQYP
ncbi:MAG: divergent PAP2 family protein [bacterium]